MGEEETVSMKPGAILLLVAVVLFLLAAFKVNLGDLDLVTLGLAAFAGSFLIDTWRR
jgi:hypothetical protein